MGRGCRGHVDAPAGSAAGPGAPSDGVDFRASRKLLRLRYDSATWFRMGRAFYDACLDARDYRPAAVGNRRAG